MTRHLVCSLLVAFFHSSIALAKEPAKSTPIVFLTGAMSYGASLSSLDPLPPAVVHGLGVLVPLKGGWGYYSEAAFTTGLADFQPGFLVISGPSRRVSDHLTIGATGMYKVVPSFDDAAPSMHILGLSAAVILPTSFGSFSVPCGVSYNVTVDDPSFVCNVKVSIRPK